MLQLFIVVVLLHLPWFLCLECNRKSNLSFIGRELVSNQTMTQQQSITRFSFQKINLISSPFTQKNDFLFLFSSRKTRLLQKYSCLALVYFAKLGLTVATMLQNKIRRKHLRLQTWQSVFSCVTLNLLPPLFFVTLSPPLKSKLLPDPSPNLVFHSLTS